MLNNTNYLDTEFVIWNSKLGIRDFVTIGRIETDAETTLAWLEVPYEMVGPLCLEDLYNDQEISFAACIVMTRQKWSERQNSLRQEAFINQQRAQEKFHEEFYRRNKKRAHAQKSEKQRTEQESRQILSLPLEGVLEVCEIKAAYRKLVKSAHPDMGGSDTEFVALTEARNALLKYLQKP